MAKQKLKKDTFIKIRCSQQFKELVNEVRQDTYMYKTCSESEAFLSLILDGLQKSAISMESFNKVQNFIAQYKSY